MRLIWAYRNDVVSGALQIVHHLMAVPRRVRARADDRHCARPLHERLGLTASTRASGYVYTTEDEIDALADGLEYVRSFFGGAR